MCVCVCVCVCARVCVCVCVQVERSVVNKLAAAYEKGVIGRSSHVTLVVSEEGPTTIKLQVNTQTNKQ